MTKASIIKIEHAPSTAGQFQPVVEMSLFPASPDRAGAGKGRLSRLSNNSVQGVALLSMLGLAACSSDTGVYLDGGSSLPGGGSNIDLGGGGSGAFNHDASGVSVANGIVSVGLASDDVTGYLDTTAAENDASPTVTSKNNAATAAQAAAEQITQGISNLNHAPSIDGQNIAAQFKPSSNLHQSQAGYNILLGGKAKGSYKNDAGVTVKVEYIQHPVLTALLEQPVTTNGVDPSAGGAPYFDVDLSTISAGVAAVQDGTVIDEIGFMVSFAHYSISSLYDPYILPTPIYRPAGDVRQADVDPANKLGAYVRNIADSANPDFIRGNDSANQIDGGDGDDIFYLDISTLRPSGVPVRIIKDFDFTISTDSEGNKTYSGDIVRVDIASENNNDLNVTKLFEGEYADFVDRSAKFDIDTYFLDENSTSNPPPLKTERQNIDIFIFEGYEWNYADLQEYLENGGLKLV